MLKSNIHVLFPYRFTFIAILYDSTSSVYFEFSILLVEVRELRQYAPDFNFPEDSIHTIVLQGITLLADNRLV